MRKNLLVFFCVAGFLLIAPGLRAEFVNVSPAAFTSLDGTAGAANGIFGQYVIKSGSAGWLYAPVNLPDGVVIKNIRVHYYDNAAADLGVNFVRVNHFIPDYNTVFYVESSGASTSHQWKTDSTHDTVAAHRLVSNGACTYFIVAVMPAASSDLRIYSVQIEYN